MSPDCATPHHTLLCKMGDGAQGGVELGTLKFNANPPFMSDQRNLGLVRRRLTEAANLTRVPSNDSVNLSSAVIHTTPARSRGKHDSSRATYSNT